ncbi:MAG TPA: cytochrome c3 family protein [Syntrophorhabdaceae bacterium]|nr:cytochrome c3 family protein [Syntrophorhabdaceae bacterium]
MKKVFIIVIAISFIFLAINLAISLVDNNMLIYGGGGQGKVIFDHQLHASKGITCKDCHLTLFDTHKKALFTMDEHFTDKKCFNCHDGKKTFNECNQCHRKF